MKEVVPVIAILAKNPIGRMLLHVGCICRGGKIHFHSAGLRREFREICEGFLPRRRN